MNKIMEFGANEAHVFAFIFTVSFILSIFIPILRGTGGWILDTYWRSTRQILSHGISSKTWWN
jgi:hypothetical protein